MQYEIFKLKFIIEFLRFCLQFNSVLKLWKKYLSIHLNSQGYWSQKNLSIEKVKIKFRWSKRYSFLKECIQIIFILFQVSVAFGRYNHFIIIYATCSRNVLGLGPISEVRMPILENQGLLGDCIQKPKKIDIYNYHVYI